VAYNVLDDATNIAKPATFVLDEDGVVRWRYVGTNKADRPPLEKALAEVAAARGR
jgi:peroxiredoxin